MATMRAWAKTAAGPGAECIRVPVPRVGSRDILVRVEINSICGTDLHIYDWDAWAARRIRPPLIFGHEFAGIAIERGAEVTEVEVGAHVSAETHIVCGHCYQCRNGLGHVCRDYEILGVDRDGVFAEYVAVPAENAWPNDPDLPADLASIQEPFGNAVHTAMAGEIVGQSVVVFGCGPTGLCAVAIARAVGAAAVFAVEINPYRQDLARRLGANEVLDPAAGPVAPRLLALTGGFGVDAALEMSGHPDSVQAALAAVRNGGRISLLGTLKEPVSLDLTEQVIFKGLTIQGITGRRMFGSWYQAKALLTSGRVDLRPLLTHRLPIGEFDRAMAIVRSGQCGKVLLDPWR